MTNEKTNEIIVNIKIKDYTFTRQRETIITWKSNESILYDNDNALSFQDNDAVNELCDTITIIYGNDKIQEIDFLEVLIEVDISNLSSIVKCLTSDQTPDLIQKIVEKIKNSNFFEKISKLFFEEEQIFKLNHINNINNEEEEEKEKKNIVPVKSNDFKVKNLISKANNNLSEKTNIKNNMNINTINNSNEEKNSSITINNYSYYQKNNQYDNNIQEDESNEIINLKLIFLIYKALLSFGNQQIIEIMLSDNYFISTFGALECKLFLIY